MYIKSRKSRSFVKSLNFVKFTIFLCCHFLNLSKFFLINTITNQINNNVWCCMLLYLHQPLLNIAESFFSSYIITKKNTISSTIENSCYWSKRLLSSSVPNLKLNNFFINFNDKRSEFDSNRNLMFQFEVVVHHSC